MARNENSKTTKELILDTAFTFLEDPRHASFSMNELASRVGISKPAIYRHFKSKDDLLDAMENRIVDNMSFLLKDIAAKDLESSNKSLTGLIQYFIENPSHINYFIAQMSQNVNYEEHLFTKLCERDISFFSGNKDFYLNNFKSDMRLFAKHIFSGMSIFYFVKLQEQLHCLGKISKTPENFSANVVNLLIEGLAGNTSPDHPLHPIQISEKRRQEIRELSHISDDAFPSENRIFTALAAVIEKYKMGGVTVERIAAELNMAKSSLYEYFDNKNQMIKCLINKELSLLNTIINENVSEAKNFTEYILIQMYSELEYFTHRLSIIPICGWLLMTGENPVERVGTEDDYGEPCNFWEKQLPEKLTSPNLGFPYPAKVITTWTGILPVAFLVEAKGKDITKEKFMKGFDFMIEYIFNGIKYREE